jgi:hypothetical protein
MLILGYTFLFPARFETTAVAIGGFVPGVAGALGETDSATECSSNQIGSRPGHLDGWQGRCFRRTKPGGYAAKLEKSM